MQTGRRPAGTERPAPEKGGVSVRTPAPLLQPSGGVPSEFCWGAVLRAQSHGSQTGAALCTLLLFLTCCFLVRGPRAATVPVGAQTAAPQTSLRQQEPGNPEEWGWAPLGNRKQREQNRRLDAIFMSSAEHLLLSQGHPAGQSCVPRVWWFGAASWLRQRHSRGQSRRGGARGPLRVSGLKGLPCVSRHSCHSGVWGDGGAQGSP